MTTRLFQFEHGVTHSHSRSTRCPRWQKKAITTYLLQSIFITWLVCINVTGVTAEIEIEFKGVPNTCSTPNSTPKQQRC